MRNIQRGSRLNTLRAGVVATTLSTALFGLIGTASYAQAQSSVPAEKLISIDLRDVRLEAAISALTNSTGLNNVVIQAVAGKSFQLVNVKLVDQPMSRALNAITASAGGIMTQQDGIYYIRPRTDADAAPTAKPEPADGQADTPKTPAAAPVAARRSVSSTQWAAIRLNYALPSDVQKCLDDPSYRAVVDREMDVTDFHVPVISQMGTAATSGPFSQPPPVAAGPQSPVQPANPPAENAPLPALPVTGSTGGLGGSAGRSDSSYTQGQRGFGGGAAGGGGRQAGGPGGGQGAGGQQRASLRPDGITNLISNDADNALLVEYDDVEDLNRLREIVKLLDVAPKQVSIKAEFINVTISDADSFGINWHFQPAGNLDALIPAAAGQSGTASILLAYSSGNAVANLQATLSHNTSNVLQAPIITTVNNRVANIAVTTEVSVAQTVIIPQTNGSPVTFTNQVAVPATNGLTVLPHINGDNSISLFLRPTLQTIDLRSDGGFDATSESLTVFRRVASGETMVLGGFINKTDSIDLQKVPLLSDLPIIGNLFTQRSHTVVGSEILVFITATIIDDHSQGNTGIGGSSPAPTP